VGVNVAIDRYPRAHSLIGLEAYFKLTHMHVDILVFCARCHGGSIDDPDDTPEPVVM
jgi:hypothetical protein